MRGVAMAALMGGSSEPWYFEYSHSIPASIDQARALLRFLIQECELTELEMHWIADNPQFCSGLSAMPESFALRHRSNVDGWIEIDSSSPDEIEWFAYYAPYAFDGYAGSTNQWPRSVRVDDSSAIGFWLEGGEARRA